VADEPFIMHTLELLEEQYLDRLGDLNDGRWGYAERKQIAMHVRQHLIQMMSMLEQTDIDIALRAALEAYDKQLDAVHIEIP
jgi:hypothetical protein